MDGCFYEEDHCVKMTLEKILKAQRKVKKNKGGTCQTSCMAPLGELGNQHVNNTIPFILYCDCDPFKVEGVTTKCDQHSKNEKFVCFATFIFRIIEIKDDCAVLELLKFKKHHKCNSKDKPISSPCSQLNYENIDDLMSTGVCINVDVSGFNAIQCLPSVCL
ncbi:CotY/CotZ family spore coat protein [Bacillus xiapuensis]|uniref:CotY/CotZ family spore coat protein n=1 Tax=Bacillus xiapuensis TaxID=2014075 RepID=A0ABU6NFB6_9BACI|nr:CotY/CotZ family spore coat protein [Bacillus xiapuensis]